MSVTEISSDEFTIDMIAYIMEDNLFDKNEIKKKVSFTSTEEDKNITPTDPLDIEDENEDRPLVDDKAHDIDADADDDDNYDDDDDADEFNKFLCEHE